MASRSGAVYRFAGPSERDGFLSANPAPSAVPVCTVGPGGLAEVGTARWAADPDGAGLSATLDWPDDREQSAGPDDLATYCEFDDDGRLIRIVVDAGDGERPDDGPDEDPSIDPTADVPDDGHPPTGEPAPPPTNPPSTDPHPSLSRPPADRPAAMASGPPPPLSPTRRQAEMAANENTQTPRDDAPDHDQAATAGHDAAGNPANLADRTPAEILAENVRLQKAIAETNRKHKADRFKVEEYEKQQREAEEAKLGEAERFKRDRDAAQQARQAAEGAAKSAREELERFKLDLEIERLALASGFLYPENAPKLVDRDLIDFDEDTHKPTNLKDVLKKLVDRQPGLVQATAQRGGTPPRNGPVPRNGAGPAPREPIPLELDLMRKVNYPGGRSFS